LSIKTLGTHRPNVALWATFSDWPLLAVETCRPWCSWLPLDAWTALKPRFTALATFTWFALRACRSHRTDVSGVAFLPDSGLTTLAGFSAFTGRTHRTHWPHEAVHPLLAAFAWRSRLALFASGSI
jgi:hypothetical protein